MATGTVKFHRVFKAFVDADAMAKRLLPMP